MADEEKVVHLGLPIKLTGGSYFTRDQDTDAEVADCVKIILSFGRGTRYEEPDFGIEDPTFQTQPIAVDDIVTAISDWEPRADVAVTTVDQPDGTTSVNVQVTMPTSDDLPMEAD